MWDFLEWLGTDAGIVAGQAIDDISNAFEGADIDIDNEKIVWADGSMLTIEQSAERINQMTGTDIAALENHIIGWLGMVYTPNDFSEHEMEIFERKIDNWLDPYEKKHR